MAKATIFARQSKKDSGGTVPLYLRVTHEGRRARLSLDMRVKPRHWNKTKGRVRASHPQQTFLNQYLSDVQASADAAIACFKGQGLVPTPQRVKDRIISEREGSNSGDDLITFFDRQLEAYEQQVSTGTYQSYRAVISKFKAFWNAQGGGRLEPNDLTVRLVRNWKTWLYQEKKNKANTVGKALRVLRTFYRKAQSEGIIPREEYIWDDITIDKAKVKKSLPDMEDLEKLRTLWETWRGDLENHSKPNQWHALAYFLTAFYAGGMRFGDVANLRWEHLPGWPGPRAMIRYKMQKTDDVAALPIVPKLREIIELFDRRRGEKERVFPILDKYDLSTGQDAHEAKKRANALVNKYLGQIAKKLKIDQLSFHMSRNLSAYRYYQHTGDIYKTQQMMGHASVQQTQDYLKGFGQDIGESFSDAFG
jgi:integrase